MPTRARQTFRVHVPGEIRIVATNHDEFGQPQAVRVSAGMDVSVMLQNPGATSQPESSFYLIREGTTVTIPVMQQLTILPGW